MVVAIVGLLAGLAVPNLQGMVDHFRAAESFRQALAAVTAARSLAQRTNAPVRLRVNPDSIAIETATVSGTAESVRRTVTGFTTVRSVPLTGGTFTQMQRLGADGLPTGAAVVAGNAAATVTFCPSSDAYFRNNDADATPVCGLGNLASTSAKIVIVARGETQHVRVRRALGSVDLRSGG